MSSTLSSVTPGCVTNAALFQHPVVEEGAAPSTAAQARMIEQAAAVCASCPLAARCLFEAVTSHDVAGFGCPRGERLGAHARGRRLGCVRGGAGPAPPPVALPRDRSGRGDQVGERLVLLGRLGLRRHGRLVELQLRVGDGEQLLVAVVQRRNLVLGALQIGI